MSFMVSIVSRHSQLYVFIYLKIYVNLIRPIVDTYLLEPD